MTTRLEVGEESPPTMLMKQRGEETKAHPKNTPDLFDLPKWAKTFVQKT